MERTPDHDWAGRLVDWVAGDRAGWGYLVRMGGLTLLLIVLVIFGAWSVGHNLGHLAVLLGAPAWAVPAGSVLAMSVVAIRLLQLAWRSLSNGD